ncbi:related to N-acetyltransferase, GNAT family [Fusarium torulosum]|uniref:Related to N-acetyltransferase, GNAT family n=1 Tax=Fusarium torulosum TaxID=33205 RepID=A0AAE8SJM9_9HYPO|nr:related to N-acetyltransferase, GNAT family [Fusarium torulosum]
MSSNFHFRIATTDDAPRIQDLIHAAFRFTDASIDWIGSPELAKTFDLPIEVILNRITAPDNVFLVASNTPDGPIIGCVNVFKKTPDFGRLAFLAIDPTLQRSGLGKKMVVVGEEHLTREFGVEKIGLNALQTRKGLLNWYEKQGYVRTGEVTELPIDRARPGAQEEMVFVEMEKGFA